MRNALTYGALGGGALLAGGKAVQEQEDPGSIFLAGLGGGAGGYAGLKGARALAGKFSPAIRDTLREQGKKVSSVLTDYAISDDLLDAMRSGKQLSPEEIQKLKRPGSRQALNLAGGIDYALGGPIQTDVGQPGLARNLGKAAAVATVPTAALAAGLGGVAAGAIPGAFGMPGFVDPESYGSSNSPGARYKQTTVNYV